MEIIFNKYQFKYIFGKDQPIHKKSLIRTINEDLKNTCELNQIPFNIKSHSFRINMVLSLLKNTSVQKAAQVIGHKSINSTMAYERYAMQKDKNCNRPKTFFVSDNERLFWLKKGSSKPASCFSFLLKYFINQSV